MILLDVTPLSLGVETIGGEMMKVIERNTTIPAQNTRLFTTNHAGQSSVEVRIYQGEHSLTTYNRLLGSFILTDIPRGGLGVPQIEVTFDIDVNGIVHVGAMEQTTGRRNELELANSGGLTKTELERLTHGLV